MCSLEDLTEGECELPWRDCKKYPRKRLTMKRDKKRKDEGGEERRSESSRTRPNLSSISWGKEGAIVGRTWMCEKVFTALAFVVRGRFSLLLGDFYDSDPLDT